MLRASSVSNDSYRYPCKGYLRVQPGASTNLYAVRAATRLRLQEGSRTEARPIHCVSEALHYSPRSFSYDFSTPLAAYKGDIVAIMMPFDNYLTYTTVDKDAEGGLREDTYFAISEGMVKSITKGALTPQGGGAVISLTPKMMSPKERGRRAAFTFYGAYLTPGD